MGRISQAFTRGGIIDATREEGDASASSDSIFNAFSPEPDTETAQPDSFRAVATRPIAVPRSVVLTAVPFPASTMSGSMSAWPSASVGPTTPVSPATADRSPATATPEPDVDRLIDPQQIGNYLGFILRAVGRRWVLSGGTAVLMLAATTAAALYWPKSYRVDAKLLVQRNEVMASLVNPGRTISREAESPTRAAEEIVLQHENLLAVIKQTDLVNRWEHTRVPVLKTKDRVFAALRSAPRTDDDRLDSMVGLLQERLKIYATPEGSVTFDLQWPDPQLAYEIVDHAIQNFLQFRRVNETSAIADSIAILDRSVETLEAQVTQTISELPKRRTTSTVRRSDPAPAQVQVSPVVTAPSGPPPDVSRRLARLKADVELRRQDVARLEEARRLQLADAQKSLAAAKMVYAEDFPTVMALRQNVAQLSRESPELLAARREAQSLEIDYETLSTAIQSTDDAGRPSAAALAAASITAPRTRFESAPIEFDLTSGEMNDPTSLRLKVELAELATVRERANAARAELSSSQAGFKYQYTVIRPPQVPRDPASPNVPAFLGAGVLASLLLAAMAAVAADLAGGKVLEAWQVERQLGVPVALTLQER